ncbi:MAG: hypothetical protein ACP5SJ_01845 [Candidatus Micrarchaeia archaeon]
MLPLLIPLLLLAFNLSLLLVFSYFAFKRGAKDLIAAIVPAALVVASGFALQSPAYSVIVAASFAAIFSELAIQYANSSRFFAPIFLVAVLELFLLWLYYGFAPIYLFAIGFSLGTSSGLEYFQSLVKNQNMRSTSRVEISRDFFQIFLGAVVIAVVLFFNEIGAAAIALLGIVAYMALRLLSSCSSKSSHYSKAKRKSAIRSSGSRRILEMLLSFEREGTVFGLGALYLLSGYMLLFGAVHEIAFLLFGIAVLTLSDSAATIVGRSAKRRHPLPYNHSKSAEGSSTFFIVSFALGIILLGNVLFALLASVLLAFLESAPLRLDDNILVASAIAAFYLLFLLL